MVGITKQAVCYAIVTVLSLLSIIYNFVKALQYNGIIWELYLTQAGFIFLIGTVIYAGYMTFLSFKSAGEPLLTENMVNSQNTIFIKDVFFKYLISFGIALLLFWIISQVGAKFDLFDKFENTVNIYTSLILPILLIIDAKYFDHLRCPQFSKDMIIIIVTLAVHVMYSFLCNMIAQGFSDGFKSWNYIVANDLYLFVFTFNGYLVYDYLLFRKTSQDNYLFEEKK